MLEALEPDELRTALVAAGVLAAAGWAVALLLWQRGVRLASERDLARERTRQAAELEERARDAFEAVAGKALSRSSKQFLTLARETLRAQEKRGASELDRRRDAVRSLVKPIDRALARTHEELARLGRENAGLRTQVKSIAAAHRELSRETGRLSQALRRPNVRGRYGEVQLERVVELSGMRPYCDFATQVAHDDAREGHDGRQRPDLVVRLPNGRVVVVDAKTPVDGYLDAVEAETEDEAAGHMARFAAAVAEQVDRLSAKEYHAALEGSPELVVMFVPGDQLVDAALRERPDLVERAAERDVILASPSTLIGLLRAVHAGWREQRLEEGARELYAIGRELHRRSAALLGHADELGRSLSGAVSRYNALVGSMERRVLPSLRRFEEHGADSGRDLATPRPVDDAVRAPMPRREGERAGDASGAEDRGEESDTARHDPPAHPSARGGP